MADYNPHTPRILGNEYVGIRDEDLIYDPLANSFERGYGFTIATTRQLDTVRSYIHEFPDGFVSNNAITANIYPRGLEDKSGPIRKVVIPCNNGIITGDAFGGSNSWSFGGNATTVATAFSNPSAENCIVYRVGQLYNSSTYIFFAVNQYRQLLYNKRILGVNFLVGVDVGTFVSSLGPNDQGSMQLWLGNDFNIVSTFTGRGSIRYPDLFTPSTPSTDVRLDRIRLGDVARYYGTTGFNMAAPNFNVSQWTYPELARFEQSAANRINMELKVSIVGVQSGASSVLITYAALEVFYCEETRLAYGTKLIQQTDFSNTPIVPYALGANSIVVRDPGGNRLNLTPGNYTLTYNQSNLGDSYDGLRTSSRTPKYNELRVLNDETVSVPGIQVNVPYPLNDEAIEQTLTAEDTLLIPQLSMHTTGGTMTESAVYGRIGPAQVWGNIGATQEIYDEITGVNNTYQWVRFYCRRFGETTTPLTLSATLSISGVSTTSITPSQFDALPEIVDGWKQVDLRFANNPIMGTGGGTEPSWTWTATGELAGNRWEVLSVVAPAVTGLPGNNLNFSITANQLFEATYQPPGGSAAELIWVPQGIATPYVSGFGTQDDGADAVLIFAQDMPTVTGFAVSVLSQPVTGIGQDCGINPCGIPTAILYNNVTWGLPVNTGLASDAFGRTVVSGLGSADVGGAYTLTGAASQYNVASNQATIVPDASGSNRIASLSPSPGAIDFNTTVVTGLSNTAAATSSARMGLVGRYTDASNFYLVYLQTVASTGVTTLNMLKRVAGSDTTLGSSIVMPFSVNAGAKVNLRFTAMGTSIKAKAWPLLDEEPPTWQIEVVDTSLTTGGGLGLFARSETATGNTMTFTDLVTGPPSFWFSYLELQRSDSLTDWATIMKATDYRTTSFKDYEARIGLQSSYRIRGVSVLDFPGQWSSTVTITPPAPGVSGSCLDDAHIMVFTTNSHQSGSSNLAYSNAWEGRVQEDFDFPEGGMVQLQAMYDRNFFTAFHPLERGGEQFRRQLLVQAAAIAPETLADFTALRDMAWASVPYICVRDEDGNRWFASVSVPGGVVRNRRQLYTADIQITEVTDTPAEVDP